MICKCQHYKNMHSIGIQGAFRPCRANGCTCLDFTPKSAKPTKVQKEEKEWNNLTNQEIVTLWKRLRERVGMLEPTQPELWLAYVRSLSCSRCHDPAPSEPHHFMGSAGSFKSSGIFTIPVCRDCHEFYETNGSQFNGLLLETWCEIAHEWIKVKIFEEIESKRKQLYPVTEE